MRKFLFVLLLIGLFALATACAADTAESSNEGSSPAETYEFDGALRTETITIWHDDARNVTCWIASDSNGVGISCLSNLDIG